MNILMIGNGFDLAHNLCTTYMDFLNMINIFNNIKNIDVKTQFDEFIKNIRSENVINIFRQYWNDRFINTNCNLKDIYKELGLFLTIKEHNFWVIYFNMILEDPKQKKTDWFDFESEIKNVIIYIENIYNKYANLSTIISPNILKPFNNDEYSAIKYAIQERGSFQYYSDLIDTLANDLDELIFSLQIYLEKFVNPIAYNKKLVGVISPDILSCNIDKVISFNYTKTYESLYDNKHNIEYSYIHGKADINNTIETTNIVLGIEEYLSENKKDTDLRFIDFKKYFQMLCKETDCKYKSWINKINKNPNKKNNLFIFGHSLTVSDKDIIKELILNEHIHTIIFYHSPTSKKMMIKNLVEIIGQDLLIYKMNCTHDIEFKLQQNMLSIR